MPNFHSVICNLPLSNLDLFYFPRFPQFLFSFSFNLQFELVHRGEKKKTDFNSYKEEKNIKWKFRDLTPYFKEQCWKYMLRAPRRSPLPQPPDIGAAVGSLHTFSAAALKNQSCHCHIPRIVAVFMPSCFTLGWWVPDFCLGKLDAKANTFLLITGTQNSSSSQKVWK